MLAIVLELQARGKARAEDLAHTFEVSKRTIYRDITALSEARVPIVASPGAGYRLMDGYFLPPLSFSPDEAAMLVLGVRAVRSAVDAVYREAAEGATRKLEAVLPADARARVQELGESMRISGGWASEADLEKMAALRGAILDRRVVRMLYHSPRREGPTERAVEPYALRFSRGVWQLTGFCQLRGAARAFRVDRIDDLMLTDLSFERDPELLDGARPRRREAGGDWLEVRVRFAPGTLRWVREEQHWSMQGEEPDGVLLYGVGEPADIVPWLLRWGAAAEVLAPDCIRDALRDAALAITNKYSTQVLC